MNYLLATIIIGIVALIGYSVGRARASEAIEEAYQAGYTVGRRKGSKDR